jgi:hypothetical protein
MFNAVWGHHKIKGLAKITLGLLFFGFQNRAPHLHCTHVRYLLSLWQNKHVSTDLVEHEESAANGYYKVTLPVSSSFL